MPNRYWSAMCYTAFGPGGNTYLLSQQFRSLNYIYQIKAVCPTHLTDPAIKGFECTHTYIPLSWVDLSLYPPSLCLSPLSGGVVVFSLKRCTQTLNKRSPDLFHMSVLDYRVSPPLLFIWLSTEGMYRLMQTVCWIREFRDLSSIMNTVQSNQIIVCSTTTQTTQPRLTFSLEKLKSLKPPSLHNFLNPFTVHNTKSPYQIWRVDVEHDICGKYCESSLNCERTHYDHMQMFPAVNGWNTIQKTPEMSPEIPLIDIFP